MAKKITLKNKNGDVLCPHTAIEQVQGLKAALDEKLGKTEAVVSADRSKYIETLHQSNGTWYGDNYKAYIQWEDSNTAKLKIDGYFTKTDEAIDAINADKAKTLKTLSGTVQDLNNLSVDSSSVEYYGYLPGSSSNMPTHNAWQNSVMCFGLHSNGATAQMFFSKDNPLYYRSSHTGEWKQLRTMDDLVTTSHIADTAITPAKIQTSIALNGTPSMTVEPTTSSPDKTIASVGFVKKAVADLEIDTRNLLTNSKKITADGTATASGGTKYISKTLPISVAVGDEFTFNCEDLVINAGTDQTHGLILYSWTDGALSAMKYVSPTSRTVKLVVTKASTTPCLYLYAGEPNNSAGKSVTYKGATLVKGDKPMLLWQAAPEDLPTKAGVINLISASDLELGGIADSNGANSATTNANRARTAGYIPVTSSQLALKSWTDDVVFYLQLYKSDKTHIGTSYSSTGWISSGKAYTLPEGTAYIRLVLKKNSGANFTTSELSTIKLKAEYSNRTTDWYPSLDDVKAAARPTVYYQSTQPPVLTAHEGDIWIVS